MSGYLYPYAPYPTAGNLQSAGQAFLGGFGAGQEIESRAQDMDVKNQLQKLRQAEEERQRQAFPLRMQLAEQQMKFAAQNQPLTLERMRLTNQQLQASLAALAQQRAAAAELARLYGPSGSGAGVMPSAAAPQPAAPPPLAPPVQGYPGLLEPYTPRAVAPAAPRFAPYGEEAPGPRSNLDFGVQRFGDRDFGRRFTGVQVASGGINVDTGLPAGVTPEMLEPDYQRYPQTGYPVGPQEGPSPTAPGALPAALLPPEQRAGAVAPVIAPPALPSPTGRLPLVRPDIIPSPSSPRLMDAAVAELSASPSLQTPDVVQRVAGQYGVDPNVLAQRLGVTLPAQAAAPQTTATEQAPYGENAPGLAGAIPAIDYTPAPTEGPAGLRQQGAPTQQQVDADVARRLNNLTTETPDPLSPMDSYRVGVESRALDIEARNIEVATRRIDAMRREAAILARGGNTQGAIAIMTSVRNAEAELEARSSALALQRANLNGRINTSEFAAGNFGPMANDIFQASGGRLRLQPVAGTDNFNLIGPDGQVRGTRTRQQLINDGRYLYETNYQNQIKAIRERLVKRSDEIFKATAAALEQSLKDTSAATRDIAIERAKQQAEAAYRASEIKVTVDTQNGLIIFQDSRGIIPRRILRVVPARDARGRPIQGQFATEEVEAQARPAQ